MAIGETPITVLGTVISDVTLKRVGSNENALATFLIRSTERKWDKEKGTWADHRHFTVRVKCWRKLAVTVASTLTKGDPVIVAGRLFAGEVEGAEGQARGLPEVDAWAVGPNLTLCKVLMPRPGPAAEASPKSREAPAAAQRDRRTEAKEPVPTG